MPMEAEEPGLPAPPPVTAPLLQEIQPFSLPLAWSFPSPCHPGPFCYHELISPQHATALGVPSKISWVLGQWEP